MNRIYPLRDGQTLAGYSCNGVNVEGDVESIAAVRKAFWEAQSQKQRADLLAQNFKEIVLTDEMVEAGWTAAVNRNEACGDRGGLNLGFEDLRTAISAALAARK